MSLVVGLAGCGFQLARFKREGDDSKSRGGDGASGRMLGTGAAVTGPLPEQNSGVGEIRANQRLDNHQGTCPIILYETSLKGVRMRSNLGASRKHCPFPSGALSVGMERDAALKLQQQRTTPIFEIPFPSSRLEVKGDGHRHGIRAT